MKDKPEPYVLRFDGRIPVVRYYLNREEGIKAREKARAKGFHVLLHKIVIPEEVEDAEARLQRPEASGGGNDSWYSRFARRFRKGKG